MPNSIIIFIRHGIVGIFPIHPLPKSYRLLCLYRRIFHYPFFTFLDKLIYAIGFNIFFSFKTKFFFNFYLNPKALAIKTILISFIKPLHGFVPLAQVFIRSAPSMVNTHGIISSNWTIQIRPALFAFIFFS